MPGAAAAAAVRRRPSSASARPPRGLRCDGKAGDRGLPCSAKLRPRGRTDDGSTRSALPPQQEDGGVRAEFGRAVGLVYPPTGWLPEAARARPLGRNLRREYVYGYNGACKNSIHFIGDTECVYPVACLVVVMDFVANTQRYFEGHSNDVTCVAWNERRRLVASGQMDEKGGADPYICIWTPQDTSRTICQLAHPRGSRKIFAVALSPDGQTAVSFTNDDQFTVFLWRDFARWDGCSHGAPKGASAPDKVSKPVFSESSGRQPTNSIAMCPESEGRNLFFYSWGDAPFGKAKNVPSGTFSFWNVTLPEKGSTNDPLVSQKRGIYGKSAVTKNPTCIVPAAERGSAWMVGDNGHMYVVAGNTVTRSKRAAPPHADVPLGCIAALPDGRWLAGGADGALYIGRADPVPVVEDRWVFGEDLLGAEAELFRSTQVPRFADVSLRGDLALMGTSNHALVLVDVARKEVVAVLQVSHPDTAWGLEFHPSLAILGSVSVARDVRFWNVAERRPAVGRILRTERQAFALAFSPDGQLLALGCDQGVVEVYAFPSLQPVFREAPGRLAGGGAGGRFGGERVGEVRFSADGALLAAACWDQTVYLLRVRSAGADNQAEVRLHKVLTGNSSSPVCVMFSADGEYIMSNSKDTQILVWRTKDGARQKAMSAFRDTRWQFPWTCVIGWPTIGVWADPDYDGTDVKSVCQAFPPESGYLAMGDDKGCVKLLRFPSPFLDPPCQVCTGHAAMVTKVRFSRTNVLASIGGDDHAICQWALEPVGEEARPPVRVVHPWEDLEGAREDADAALDRYGFLGASRPPRPRPGPRPAFAPEDMPDVWGEARPPFQQAQAAGAAAAAGAGAWGGGAPGGQPPQQQRRRASSAAAGTRDAMRAAGVAAGAEFGARRRTTTPTPGARSWSSNQSHGVGQALQWGG